MDSKMELLNDDSSHTCKYEVELITDSHINGRIFDHMIFYLFNFLTYNISFSLLFP
jgi:hypothetical protein